MKSCKAALVMVCILFLSACAQSEVLVDRATEIGKREKDTVARAVLPATCAISVGAWSRLENQTDQYGVALICGFYDMLRPPADVQSVIDFPAPLSAPVEVE